MYPSLENSTAGIAINAEVHAGSKSYCSPCQIWICTKSALYSTSTLLVLPILNKILKIICFQIHFLSNFSQCYVLPVNPLDSTSIWKSTKCNCCQLDLEKVDEIVKKLLEEKNSLEKKDVPAHLDFLKKAEKSLHPNHYIIKITQRWILPMTNCQIWCGSSDSFTNLKFRIYEFF